MGFPPPPFNHKNERNGGVVALDVLMGYTSQQQSCTGSPQQVSTSTNNGVTSFNWAPNDQFVISITSGSSTEIIRLHTEAGAGENAGTAYYYKIAQYSCLSNPSTSESSDHKELSITAASNTLTLRGYDNNDGVTTRHIEIAHPAGYSFVVMKY